jgi:hypothetical protein
MLRQKKNYGNSRQKKNLQKTPLKETKILQEKITLQLISQVSKQAKI